MPHADRAGCLYLASGALTARDGTLAFLQGAATEADALAPGDYAIPLQGVSIILLGPGSTVSHDALRLIVIVTRNVEARYRGSLTSVMLEISAGVYVAPDMSHGVHDRVWAVLTDWWETLRCGSLLMVWRDKAATDHLQIETLGEPPKIIVDADGILLVKRE